MSAITDDVLITPQAYVSLYAKTPFYGGPEEGGWWGHDVVLVSHQGVSSTEEAEAVKARFNAAAKVMGVDSSYRFGMQCADELAQAEALGIDPDSLPEADGETTYFAAVENLPGSHEERGDRTYS